MRAPSSDGHERSQRKKVRGRRSGHKGVQQEERKSREENRTS